MWPLKLVTALVFSLVLAACRNHSEAGMKQGDRDSARSVETREPNAGYMPAFTGQTRARRMKTETPLSVTVINHSLQQPWAICNLPGGRFLVTEKQGSMVMLAPDGKTLSRITGLPEVASGGQGGLLDVIADPRFAASRMIYWTYAEPDPDRKNKLLAVAKGRLSEDGSQLENPVVIYRARPAYKGNLHFGSRIVFDQEGNLFVSAGERSDKEMRVRAQDLSAALGKILHISPEGKPVPGGPFAQMPNALPEIYAYGLRNPQGLAWNPRTSELWEAEFGPRGGDEVNIIRPGNNYGWPEISYGLEYSGEKVTEGLAQKPGMEQPVYYWDPSVSPSGIAFYNGNQIPEWEGNLFLACLSGSHIIRLAIENNRVQGEERLLEGRGERFRALTTGQDGALYIVTDGGKLYRIGNKTLDQDQ